MSNLDSQSLADSQRLEHHQSAETNIPEGEGSGSMEYIQNRVAFLDGFRGLAVLAVIFYHYYSSHSYDPRSMYPFAGMVSDFPLFKYGFYGVQLFFSVSGFVIVMTLERSGGLIEFAVKRLARLWPTIWPVFWRRNLQDFLPSLTFLDSYVVWKKVLPGIQFS